jgi:hypothetical protein
MLNFTLDDETLLWGFFDILGISHQDLFLEVIRVELNIIIPKEYTDMFLESVEEELKDFISECGIRTYIEAEAIDEFEVDESTGTWGHYVFEIHDDERTKDDIEKELKREFSSLVKKMHKEGRFNKYK